MAENREYRVLKDDEVVAEMLTSNQAFTYVLRHQGQSVQHAMRYEGWAIMDDATYRASYRHAVKG